MQETLYIGQWCLSPLQSRHVGTSHSSPRNFPESHWWSEIYSFSKVIVVLGEVRSHRAPNLSCMGAESPGWFEFWQKTLHKMWCMSRCVVLWWICQSSVAHSCGLLNHPNSFRGGIFKLNAKSDADSLLYLLSHFWMP